MIGERMFTKEGDNMIDTKEKILMTSLHLFARDGYEAVSVSMIAKELGITKGALYKHYKNKRDIFDSIVERMFQIDAKRSQQYHVPEEIYEVNPMSYEDVSIENIKNFTMGQYLFWTEDESASDFRRMLSLEQYRSQEMAELYSQCLTSGPVQYMEDIFRKMIDHGQLKDTDPQQLAIAFYAPMYLFINISDHCHDKEKNLELLKSYIHQFFKENKNEIYKK